MCGLTQSSLLLSRWFSWRSPNFQFCGHLIARLRLALLPIPRESQGAALVLLSQKVAGNRDQNQLLGEIHVSADGG